MLNVEELRKQEERYQFAVFNHQSAFDLAMTILEKYKIRIAGREMKEGLGIRIRIGELVVFQYLMDKKDEDEWLRKKERVVWASGIGSMLAAALHQQDGRYAELADYSTYCLGCGGFPIKVNGELIGSVCVSGMPDLEDHDLLIEALEAYCCK